MARQEPTDVDLHQQMLENINRAIDKLTFQESHERKQPKGEPTVGQFRQIVACYDSSPSADQAVAWAGHLADLSRGHVNVVSVAPLPRPAPQAGWTVGWIPRISEEIVRQQEKAKDAAKHAAASLRDLGREVETFVPKGGTTHEIVEFAKTHASDLVVVGSGGRKLGLGSVAGAVLGRAPSSVLIARGPVPAERILIAVDGSPASRRAATMGLRYAEDTGAEVTVLHVFDYEGDESAIPTQGYLKEVVEKMDLQVPPRVKYVLEVGDPAERIVARAEEERAGLVILGSRGHGRVEGYLLGSVSQRVASACPTSTLVVKPWE